MTVLNFKLRGRFPGERTTINYNKKQKYKRKMEWYNYVIATKSLPIAIYSGATNNLKGRVQKHSSGKGSLRTRNWGEGNCSIIVTIGPTKRNVALAIERCLKNTIIRGGGINGRFKAIIKLLTAGMFSSKTVKLTSEELRHLKIRTCYTIEHVAAIVQLSENELRHTAIWEFSIHVAGCEPH